MIHRGVGIAQQGFDVITIVRIDRNTGAEADEDILTGNTYRLFKSPFYLVEYAGDGVCVVQVVSYDDKLITTIAGKNIVLPNVPAKPNTYLLQELITDAVAKTIVDPLEVVHVQKDDSCEVIEPC